jgi:lysophospholipase L1-like esterase
MTSNTSNRWSLILTAALLAFGLAPLSDSSRLTACLRMDGRNARDLEQMERSYYEHVLAANQSGVIPATQPPPFKDGPLALWVSDYRECVLKAGLAVETRHGRWTTNTLGLRDREYLAEKPPGTYRVLLLGDSIGAGWGVEDGQGFEPLLEAALDARSRSSGGPAVEILNLCVPGFSPGQRLEHFKRLGEALQPDVILYEATAADLAWDERRLRVLLPKGVGADLSMFASALERAGWPTNSNKSGQKAALARLKNLRPVLLEGVYRELVRRADALEIPVIWVLVPRVGRANDPIERKRFLEIASHAGFAQVLDFSQTFEGMSVESLAVCADDYHPNARGHALLAKRLEAEMAFIPQERPFQSLSDDLMADVRGERR